MNTATSILVFRIGQLGDTIIALPALWAIRRHFPTAHLTLLSDRHPHKQYVLASDLLRDSGLFDCFESYPVDSSAYGKFLRPWRILSLLQRLRAKRFDALFYLPPSSRTPQQVERDRKFFKAVGIKKVFGMEPESLTYDQPFGQSPSRVKHEADLLLARLAGSGIPVSAFEQNCMDLGLSQAEEKAVQHWLASMPTDNHRPWIGFGPGSKMAAKKWPAQRFGDVGQELIRRFDAWPVVFGGPEDQPTAEQLLRTWKRGFNAAGKLGLRSAAAALRRCLLYVGNDTGTMHLAAAVGTPCAAIFSARDWPGRWDPYGAGHQVLRAQIDCEGCRLLTCVERKGECLSRITVSDVLNACERLLSAHPSLACRAQA